MARTIQSRFMQLGISGKAELTKCALSKKKPPLADSGRGFVRLLQRRVIAALRNDRIPSPIREQLLSLRITVRCVVYSMTMRGAGRLAAPLPSAAQISRAMPI
jgi:hypothetical protein